MADKELEQLRQQRLAQMESQFVSSHLEMHFDFHLQWLTILSINWAFLLLNWIRCRVAKKPSNKKQCKIVPANKKTQKIRFYHRLWTKMLAPDVSRNTGVFDRKTRKISQTSCRFAHNVVPLKASSSLNACRNCSFAFPSVDETQYIKRLWANQSLFICCVISFVFDSFA